jgi:hypothetical protein
VAVVGLAAVAVLVDTVLLLDFPLLHQQVIPLQLEVAVRALLPVLTLHIHLVAILYFLA